MAMQSVKSKKKKHICPVCGFPLDYPPEDFNICPSCGVEFEYETAGRSFLELRQEWLNTGARWASKVIKPPKGWDAMKQLARLEGKLIQEIHYGTEVWVNAQTDEMRREECLCLNCKRMDDCAIAKEGLRLCRLTDIAFMVTRCPKFIKD